MNTTRTKRAAPLLILALLAAGIAACTTSSKGPSISPVRREHPDVGADGTETCSRCHADATPEVTRAWREGRHGLALVECQVCHGSTGADFRVRPEPGLCAGCHAAEVLSVTLGEGRIQDCFACHPAHALRPAKGARPHGTVGGGRP